MMSSDGAEQRQPISLGVLLVHGIGSQGRGATLTTWVDEIVRVIESGTKGLVDVEVDMADLRAAAEADDKTPPHAFVRIHSKSASESWLFAEAWWADSFAAPSYGQLVTWSFRAIPWTLATHFVQTHHRRISHTKGLVQIACRAWTVVQVSLALLLAPFLALLLLFLLVVGLIPIGAIRNLVAGIQRALTATAGDSMVLLESPVRAAAIRGRFLGALAWLRSRLRERPGHGVEPIAIVAHSQGATISYEALRGIGKLGEPQALLQDDESGGAKRPMQACYVTFGAGISKQAALRQLESDSRHNELDTRDKKEPRMGKSIRTLQWVLLMVVLVVAWLWWLVISNQVNAIRILLVPCGFIAFAGLMAVMFGAANLWSKRSRGHRLGSTQGSTPIADGPSKPPWWIMATLFVVCFGVPAVVMVCGDEATIGTMLPYGLLMLTIPRGAEALHQLLSRWFHEQLLALMREPVGVAAWSDYYASRDPVPNGETVIALAKETVIAVANMPRSEQIWNAGSLIRDHTSYWENRDGFVLPLVSRLATTARSAWHKSLPESSSSTIKNRSRWRVRLRQTVWFVVMISSIFAMIVQWGRIETWMRDRPGDWPAGLGAIVNWDATRRVMLCAVALIGGQLLFVIPDSLWRSWVRSEQAIVLGHGRPSGIPTRLVFFVCAAGVAVSVAIFVGGSGWERPIDFLQGIAGALLILWTCLRFIATPQLSAAAPATPTSQKEL